MEGFQGFVDLESTFYGTLLTKAASGVPTDAASLPTFRVYGPAGFITSGTCALLDAGNTNGFYSWTLPCLAASGFESGELYHVLFSYTVSTVMGQQQSFMVS